MNKNVIYKKNIEEKVIKIRINKYLLFWNFEFKIFISKKNNIYWEFYEIYFEV